MSEIEVQPWWFAALGPFIWWTINAVVRLLGAWFRGQAAERHERGEHARARTWEALEAVASNLQVGRPPSVRPPPATAIHTLPPPPPMPFEIRFPRASMPPRSKDLP